MAIVYISWGEYNLKPKLYLGNLRIQILRMKPKDTEFKERFKNTVDEKTLDILVSVYRNGYQEANLDAYNIIDKYEKDENEKS